MSSNTMITPDDNDKLNEILKQLQESNEMTGKLLNNLAKATVGVSDNVTKMQGDMNDVKGRVTALEEDQFVTPYQDANIQKAARIHVSDLLGLRWEKGGVVEEDMPDYNAYYGRFLRALHSDAKKAGLEGPKIHQTARKNYAKLIEFIGEWVPIRGVEGQKEYYDALARAKRQDD